MLSAMAAGAAINVKDYHFRKDSLILVEYASMTERALATLSGERPRPVHSIARGRVAVLVEKRNGAFFRVVKCTTSRPPWPGATGGTRHGEG